jgi:hypothetical protein
MRASGIAARLLPAAVLAALAAALPAAAGAAPLTVIYGYAPAADAIHDGAAGLAGLTDVVRQAPIFDDPRFPAARQIGKVAGKTLAALDAEGMAQALRDGMTDPRLGPLAGVGVDEIGVADFGPQQSADLERALELLGPDAERVVLYVAPSLVGAVGQRDPRKPLKPRIAAALDALDGAGAVMLTMFHGSSGPLSRQRFAVFPTRWLARFPADRRDRLHLLIGPDHGRAPGTLWSWARATPAGREILANGAGAFGHRTAEEGLSWLRGARVFMADPTAEPLEGDFPTMTGGLSLRTTQTTVVVRLTRHGRGLVRLVPVGERRGQVIGRIKGPTPARGTSIALPPGVRPGRYRVVVVVLGQAGVRDRVAKYIVKEPTAAPLRLSAANGGLTVEVAAGQRAVVSVVREGGRRQAVAKVTGPASRTVQLPAGLPPGDYRVVAVALGGGGRQDAAMSVTVAAG